MSKSVRGISESGLSEAFLADEARKSRLILEARLLRRRKEAAAAKFAEAAAIEERLGDACAKQQLQEKSFVHYFSAASCWASVEQYSDLNLVVEFDQPQPKMRQAKRVGKVLQAVPDSNHWLVCGTGNGARTRFHARGKSHQNGS